MNPTTESIEPIQALEVFFNDTNALAVQDQKRAALIAILKPIADLIEPSLTYANLCQVNNAEQAKDAASNREEMIEAADQAEKAIRSFDDNLLERMFKTHRTGTALIARFAVLTEAAKRVKGKIIGWQSAEEEKAEKERQRLQAIADEAARKEQERLEKLADKRVTPEVKEKYREQAAAVTAPVIHVAAPTKTVKSQTRWFVKSIDLQVFIVAAAENRSLAGYITVDETKLARAKSANKMIEIPGVEFESRLV